jgi:hypothetical protein
MSIAWGDFVCSPLVWNFTPFLKPHLWNLIKGIRNLHKWTYSPKKWIVQPYFPALIWAYKKGWWVVHNIVGWACACVFVQVLFNGPSIIIIFRSFWMVNPRKWIVHKNTWVIKWFSSYLNYSFLGSKKFPYTTTPHALHWNAFNLKHNQISFIKKHLVMWVGKTFGTTN